MTDWSLWQKLVFLTLVLMCAHYLYLVAADRIKGYTTPLLTEGFEGGESVTGKQDIYTWITDPQLIYDEFYAGVYDQLSAQQDRNKAKVALLTNLWKKDGSKPSEWSVLDAGCGTGHAVAGFAKIGAGRIVGMDFAPAMLRQAEKTLAQEKLTEEQKQVIRWRQDSLINPSACAAGEFTHAVCFYFSVYYLKDQEEFFRHMNLWCKPGGKLAVEVVNKHKFDPVLESAAPFLGFSVQKYSKERILKSNVTFDKFDYQAEFNLTDPKAEFYETFRFKNGHVRRQKHEFTMPAIEKIVEMGKRAGWKYIGYQDLNPIGFEYAYLLTFEK